MKLAFWRRETLAAVPPPPAASAPRRDWALLPPLQRTVGPMPETGGGTGFVRDLAGSQPPELVLQPLGHEVSPRAPAGLVTGLARPIEYAESRAMVSRILPSRRRPGWLQRMLSASQPDAAAEAAQVAQVSADEPQLESDPGQESVSLDTEVEPEEDLPPPLPARSLEVVSNSEPAPPARPLTVARFELAAARRSGGPVAEAAAAPAPKQTEAEVGDATPAAALTPVAARLTLGQSRRLGLGPPISRSPSLQRSQATAHPPGLEISSPPTQPAAAPIPSTPGGTNVEGGPEIGRKPDAAPRPDNVQLAGLASPVQLRLQRRSEANVPGEAPEASHVTVEPQRQEPFPAAPQVGPSTHRADAQGQPEYSAGLASGPLPATAPVATVQRLAPNLAASMPPSASPIVLPLVSRRPEITVVRQALPGTSASTRGVPAFADVPSGESGGREAPLVPAPKLGLEPAPAGELPPPAPPVLQALRLDAPQSDSSRSAPTVPQMLRFDAPRSAPPVAQMLRSDAVAQRQSGVPEMPAVMQGGLARSAERTPLPPLARLGWNAPPVEVAGPVVQTFTGQGIPAGPAPAVAAMPEPEPTVQREGEGVAAAAAPAQSGGGSAGPVAASDKELDDLARKLYGRIRVHLRSDLLVERERAGMLIDLR